MIIESIELKNYRNYESLNIQFDPGVNIFYGDNAQGKTNILESIYVSCTSKSHRSSKDKELIQFGSEEGHIKSIIKKDDVLNRIDVHIKQTKAKGIAVNGIPIKKSSELFGISNVVFFSPEDLNIIKNGPSGRRKFLDMELCQLDSFYVYNLVNYNKLILNRNKLLKEYFSNHVNEGVLDILDLQISEFGSKLIKQRVDFLSQMNQIIGKIHEEITEGKETLYLQYEPNVQENDVYNQLLRYREKDIRLRTTSVGPHRDDISFLFGDIDLRKFGSQGQQRTAALSLKLAEIELVKLNIKDKPILLLDDVLSELDSNRQNQLLNNINHVQTIISCTGLDEFISNRIHLNKVFKVESGKVYELNCER